MYLEEKTFFFVKKRFKFRFCVFFLFYIICELFRRNLQIFRNRLRNEANLWIQKMDLNTSNFDGNVVGDFVFYYCANDVSEKFDCVGYGYVH